MKLTFLQIHTFSSGLNFTSLRCWKHLLIIQQLAFNNWQVRNSIRNTWVIFCSRSSSKCMILVFCLTLDGAGKVLFAAIWNDFKANRFRGQGHGCKVLAGQEMEKQRLWNLVQRRTWSIHTPMFYYDMYQLNSNNMQELPTVFHEKLEFHQEFLTYVSHYHQFQLIIKSLKTSRIELFWMNTDGFQYRYMSDWN